MYVPAGVVLVVLMFSLLVPRLDVGAIATPAGVAVVLMVVELLAETVRVPANPLIPVRIIVEFADAPA